jgi:hypothetical protein
MGTTNASPKIVFGGIDDQSRRPLARPAVTFAQHAPLLRLFAQTGPETTEWVGTESGGFASLYGALTLARRGQYYNLQSMLAEKLLGEGNGFAVKRLIPDDAPAPARIIIALELVRDAIPATTVALSGFDYPEDVADVSGNTAQAQAVGDTVNGLRARIITIQDNQSGVGKQRVLPGTLVAESDSTQSMVYPLFELPASFVGSGGNLLGWRAWAPTTQDDIGFDETTAAQFKTRMYRMQFLQRATSSASPAVVKTALGDDYVDVCFTEGAYSESTDKEYYIGQTLVQAYKDDGLDSGLAPLYSPFEKIYVYKDNIKTVQDLIYEVELEVNPAAQALIAAPGQIDFLTGTGIDGDLYQGILFEGPLNGGIKLGDQTTVYAVGGGDGTTDLAMYEKLVNLENDNFGQLKDQYENLAVFPFTRLYDTGLSMDGKYRMMGVLGKRQDLMLTFTTYVEAEGVAPTASEELSRAQALTTRLKAFPESTLYGTPVCRAEIIMQTGYLAGGGYTKPVPQVIDYAVRWARFGGAGSGKMREGFDIDVSPNNRVTEIKDHNVKYFNARAQSNAWVNGGSYSLSYDNRSMYYPAIHTVYNDDTSVLTSPITTSICCDLMRLSRLVHADFSGNAKLTDEQFIERCDARLLALVDGRYNGRVDLVPTTYFTADDKNNGFSWHVKWEVRASVPRTVMYLDIITERRDSVAA